MALRRFLIAGLVFAGGCATQTQQAADAGGKAGPIAFRSPRDIRPTDASVQPEPTPASSVASAVVVPPKTPSRVAGEWAPPVASRPWRYIVIHHSASPSGNAALFDREHRDKGWDELGYHFVIDNGRGGGDGNIEVGPRWTKQKWGAHAKTPDNRYNDFGIGICFVGNFEQGRPTAKQLASAQRLVAWLMQTYDIPARNVIGHEDTGKQTLCPGKYMSVAQVRTMATHALAEAGVPVPIATATPANAHVAMGQIDRELVKAR